MKRKRVSCFVKEKCYASFVSKTISDGEAREQLQFMGTKKS